MSQSSAKVLLVEDDEVDAIWIHKMLNRLDINHVLHAESLEQAINQVESDQFDAILLDLNLPDSEGLSTVVQMTTWARLTPIVILTGVDSSEIAETAKEVGFSAYIDKANASVNSLRDVLKNASVRIALSEEAS